MKLYLKSISCVIVLIAVGLTSSANAQPTLFNFTLTVKDIPNPQISVGRDKSPVLSNNQKTFDIKVRQSDYFFTVNYQHNGESKEAVCPISGTPELVTATINPAKDSWNACTTQESGRG